MAHSIAFDHVYEYPGGVKGVQVPISLCVGKQSVDLLASVDTGATFCIFERKYADRLGIDVAAGNFQRFYTAAGSFAAYGHEIELRTFQIEFTCVVYFAEDREFEKNVVGRVGFLDRLRVGIVDYERTIYLSDY